MGKAFILIGLLFIAGGLLILAGVPLGRLPGDIVYRRNSVTVYIPIATSVVFSLAMMLVLMLLRR